MSRQSVTGAELASDGAPVFAELDGEPVSRRQYLERTRPDRREALIAELRGVAETADIYDHDNEPEEASP